MEALIVQLQQQLLLRAKPEFQCEANTEQDMPMKGLHQRFLRPIEMPSFLMSKLTLESATYVGTSLQHYRSVRDDRPSLPRARHAALSNIRADALRVLCVASHRCPL